MTTLLTGGTGFVGSAVLRQLLIRGDAVRVLTRRGSDDRLIRDLDVERRVGDLNDPSSLKAAAVGCKALYHVAADYRLWIPKPDGIYRTNIEGTRDLLRVAAEAGVERIVYTSSVATLGLTGTAAPADETTPTDITRMVGHYKRSKYLAEQAVKTLVDDEKLPVVIVNPSAPIGPRDAKPTPTGRMVIDAARGAMPAYVDTGLNVVHVDDVAHGHILAFDHGKIGERYILGGEDMTLGAILSCIAALCGRSPPKVKLPIGLIMPLAYLTEVFWRVAGRTTDPVLTVDGLKMARKRMFFSSTKARVALGYSPRPPIEAIRDALAWYRQHDYIA